MNEYPKDTKRVIGFRVKKYTHAQNLNRFLTSSNYKISTDKKTSDQHGIS